MRLYQSGALLTGARNELTRRGGVLVDGPRAAAHAHGRLGITRCVAAQGDTIEHCSFAGPDRTYGSDPRALVYLGHRHIPYASLSEVTAGHTLTATSASKGWNLPGLKCAQLILATRRTASSGRRQAGSSSTARAPSGVHAGIAAFTAGQDWLAEVLAYLDRNRMLLGDLLAEHLPGIRYQPPEGTYLAWLDCRELGLGDTPGEFFLDKGSVLVNDGPAFGEAGKGHVRLNFATPWPILQEIVRQMGQAVANS